MAWNDPGKDKDPWGGGDQGPPDLDEALRRFQEKINGLFGSGGGGAAAGGAGGFSPASLVVVLVLAVLVWAAFGVYQVDQQERAVVLRFGVYLETTGPGLHWNPPLIDERRLINVTKVRSVDHNANMLTEDENIVDVALSVQYTVSDPANFWLKVRDPEASLQQALESSLRHVVGGSKMDQVITEGREQIAVEMQERLQNYIDVYETGIRVAKVNIRDSRAPAQVQDAFDDVTRAKEDKERLKNEAEAYANAIIPEARGRSQRLLEEANAYRDRLISRAQGEAERFTKLLTEYQKAPEVTRERLYLETMQEVYGNTTKIMVDVDGGNSMLYLPLDKLVGESRARSVDSQNLSDLDVREVTDRVVEQLRRDSQTRRTREGR